MKRHLAEQARDCAIRWHGSQRYGEHPYVVHLDAVATVLIRFGYLDQKLLAAAYLHDTIEDAAIDPSAITAFFGEKVTELVVAVTNPPGKNRKERLLQTYRKLQKFPDAINLKLADRIANVEASFLDWEVHGRSKHYLMYRNEFQTFSDFLENHGGDPDMWWHLAGLVGQRL